MLLKIELRHDKHTQILHINTFICILNIIKLTNTRTDTDKNTFAIIDSFYVTSAQLMVIFFVCLLVKCTETFFSLLNKQCEINI